MPFARMNMCIEVLQQWGFKVKPGKTAGSQFHYFSGTDEQRLEDLQQMLDDKEVKAILCGRGGYGLSRIIDQLDFRQFTKHPKWIIGYSDITLLHAHLFQEQKSHRCIHPWPVLLTMKVSKRNMYTLCKKH